MSLEFVLVRTEDVAVAVTRLLAYPTGFEFEVLALAAPGSEAVEQMEPMLFGPGRHRAMRGPGLPPDVLRIGVQFADGAKATNLGGFPRPHPTAGAEPAGPVMNHRGGGGGGGHWRQGLWVWPLPPPGPLAFVCEWPVFNVPLTRHEVDAELILDAADRAQAIFSEDDQI